MVENVVLSRAVLPRVQRVLPAPNQIPEKFWFFEMIYLEGLTSIGRMEKNMETTMGLGLQRCKDSIGKLEKKQEATF